MYLNAKLDYHNIDGAIQQRTGLGDVLSVCSDQIREPIRGLTVRYGKPGAALLEYRATPTKRMKMHVASTGPGMAVQVLSWSVGSHTYCITEGAGLQHGVSFYVVDGDRVASFGESSDYGRGPVEIDFYRRLSPVFVKQRPSCNL